MKVATTQIVASLALVGLLIGSAAIAGQGDSDKQSELVSYPEPGIPAPAPVPADEYSGAVPGGDELSGEDNSIYPEAGIFGPSSVGTSCEVCGGGYCSPPYWYTRQGVRIFSRSKTRGLLISSEYANQISFSQVVQDDPSTEGVDESRWVVEDSRVETPLIGSRSLDLDAAAGYYMTLGRYLGRNTANSDVFVEFGFWGLNEWTDSKTVVGSLQAIHSATKAGGVTYTTDETLQIEAGTLDPIVEAYTGSLFTPFPQTGASSDPPTTAQLVNTAFNNALEQSVFYRSGMDNFEINGRIRPRGRPDRLVLHPNGRWRRECQPGQYWSYLYGVRYMSIKERIDLLSQGARYDENVALTHEYAGSYRARTHNHLVGLQFGIDMMYRRCKWQWGVQAKIGPFVNFSDQVTELSATSVDANNTYSFSNHIAARASEVSLLGEFGFAGRYKLRPHLHLTASYDFMWVTGLALAPEQLVFQSDPPPRVNVNGHIYSHGITLGMEFLW